MNGQFSLCRLGNSTEEVPRESRSLKAQSLLSLFQQGDSISTELQLLGKSRLIGSGIDSRFEYWRFTQRRLFLADDADR